MTHIEYRCHSCNEMCLNHHAKPRTRYRECERCYSVPVLERGEPVDNLLVELRWAAHSLIVGSGILDDLDGSPDHRKQEPERGPPAMGGRAPEARASAGDPPEAPATSGGEPQWRVNDWSARTDGGR